ncbi:hypothetical protein AMTRI_Chr05g60150 [Amborella trichopoda]
MKMGLLLKITVCLILLAGFSKGYDAKYRFVKESSTIARHPNARYDYIIVGGGTAGCPLAATLSQNYSVLLLERGGSPYGNMNISLLQNFHISLMDASPDSPTQPFVSTDGVINARAKVLGGGTCINAGFYTRASPEYVRKNGWDGKLVNESYPWIEKQIVQKPRVKPWQAALRDGLLDAGVHPFNGYTYDHIYGTKVGGSIFDERGFRHTAADLLQRADASNLKVLLHATVKRVVFRNRARGEKPAAVGVEFIDEKGVDRKVFVAEDSGEVIVSAGAIGSPHLLLLSGIGPRHELKRWRIPEVLDQDNVGEGMADNPMNSVYIPTKRMVEHSLIQTVGITKVGSFIEASSGFGQSSDSIKCHHGILSAEIGQLSTLPPKQRTKEAIEAFIRNKQDLPREVFKGGFILEKVVGPLSKGHLTLNNTDIRANPVVTFNYFSHPEDLRRCVSGIQMISKIARSKSVVLLTQNDDYTMQKLLNLSVVANVNLIPKHPNDTKSLTQFCRDTVLTIWHYHGGCQVGKVVDSDYRVLGVERLRIIDGSTFLASPGTNPQATVMMLGRYMGVKLLRERLGARAGV